ncbi:HPP family protein [Methylorubrum extorquens]|uniref:HPP transmembrane region domain-containing protein n=1 Tax=Methylorubrum extorquens (strain CM4 / NCIMB 13688) TaxID=440085 RepID=B7L3M5_METC4|nr:HPP family protein [Methylorubrum extorquens]ACK86433.1 conserved hypothetical protein [Methylorubrum extorquens CM4]
MILHHRHLDETLMNMEKPRSTASSNAADGGWAAATILYVAAISAVAEYTHATYILFPELGALAFGIFQQPRGPWSRAPVPLMLTPLATATLGTFVTDHMPFGPIAIFVTVAGSVLILRVLRSPISPALSAGLLPLTLGITSWWYPIATLLGTGTLAGFALFRARSDPEAAQRPGSEEFSHRDRDSHWRLLGYAGFVVSAALCVDASSSRLLLYPPLAVIGFELFTNPRCPWAEKPFLVPVVCTLSAAGGFIIWMVLGNEPWTAAASVALSLVIMRCASIRLPPAIAVSLLPLVIDEPTAWFPVEVGLGSCVLIATHSLFTFATAFRQPDV